MSSISIAGDTSGSIILQAPSVSGSTTLTLPTTSGTIITNTAGTVTQTMLATGVAGTGPAVSAYESGNQSISSNVWTKVTLGTEEFDTNNNFASSRFTPTVAGYYQINGSINYATFSNGSVGIYDWKGINFQSYRGEVLKVIGQYKKEAFSIQLAEYKRILREQYGVTHFRESRIIPINMQLYGGEKADSGYYFLEMGDSSGKDYLNQLATAGERTEDAELNKTIEKQTAALAILKSK
jgi:hypothetical protein